MPAKTTTAEETAQLLFDNLFLATEGHVSARI